jgi:hypothetical protein
MKITINDENLTVSIDNHENGVTAPEARELCVSALLAMTYHPDTIARVFPSDDDIDDIIRTELKAALKDTADSI